MVVADLIYETLLLLSGITVPMTMFSSKGFERRWKLEHPAILSPILERPINDVITWNSHHNEDGQRINNIFIYNVNQTSVIIS